MTEATPMELAARLHGAVIELLGLMESATDAHWSRPPAEGEWTAAEICGHIAELIPYWMSSAQALAKAPGSSFGREMDDPDRVGAVRTGAGQSRELASERVRDAAARAAESVTALPVELWSNAGVSASRGPMTVRGIIETFLVGHVKMHVAQVRAALE